VPSKPRKKSVISTVILDERAKKELIDNLSTFPTPILGILILIVPSPTKEDICYRDYYLEIENLALVLLLQ
jgi:hypothetical protein